MLDMPSARLRGSIIQIDAMPSRSAATSTSLAPSCTSRPATRAAFSSRNTAFTLERFAVSVVQPCSAPQRMLCTVCAVSRGFAFVTAARWISAGGSAHAAEGATGVSCARICVQTWLSAAPKDERARRARARRIFRRQRARRCRGVYLNRQQRDEPRGEARVLPVQPLRIRKWDRLVRVGGRGKTAPAHGASRTRRRSLRRCAGTAHALLPSSRRSR